MAVEEPERIPGIDKRAMAKVLVFDLGGTLMEYRGMPVLWAEYYRQGFEAVDAYYRCGASKADIDKSIEILKSFNPRIVYREAEYAPEYIFGRALAHWHTNIPVQDCIYKFFQGLELRAVLYPDVIPALKTLRGKGYRIGALTDLPTAMPDELFKKDITPLLSYLDVYVSSQSCGFRKPNSKGLEVIAQQYGMPIENLVFIGDEEKDRKTADNGGCYFIRIDRKEKRGDICDLNSLIEYIEEKF